MSFSSPFMTHILVFYMVYEVEFYILFLINGKNLGFPAHDLSVSTTTAVFFFLNVKLLFNLSTLWQLPLPTEVLVRPSVGEFQWVEFNNLDLPTDECCVWSSLQTCDNFRCEEATHGVSQLSCVCQSNHQFSARCLSRSVTCMCLIRCDLSSCLSNTWTATVT